MHPRDVGRLIFVAVLVCLTGVTAASCGASNGITVGLPDGTFDGPTFTNGDGGGGCKPGTCASLAYTCGMNGDGCGHPIDCGSCPAGQYCGGGGYSKCGTGAGADGGVGGCTPKSCADQKIGCGPAGDTCGSKLDCGACTSPTFCGGGGTPFQCGGNDKVTADGAPVCTPATCASQAFTCGPAGDGCGGQLDCGMCTSPQFCGGGGPSKCGGMLPPDGGSNCTPKTCASQAFTCGPAGDGCGGQLDCGTCTAPQFCGGGGASKCGGMLPPDGGSNCTPTTCTALGYTCGPAADGCGGMLNCGTCTSPQSCGGGGVFSVCGSMPGIGPDGGTFCPAATCASLGYNCGAAGDGCGNLIQCGGMCTAPSVCGGGGSPNVCGSNVPCTGLCTQQVACDGGATTTLSGTVVAGTLAKYLPAGVTHGDPVPDVVVYIPNGPVTAFVPRAMENAAQRCTTCGADLSGSPLVITTTDYKGTFSLPNVPVGNNIPIVIQLGRWRRQFTVNINTACGANTVNAAGSPAGFLVMPHNHTEGDIPLTALSTGNVDAMECVLLKMGVDAAEFTAGTATAAGRIQLYVGNGANANASGGGATPAETALMNNGGTFNNYDQIILPCWGVDPVFDATNRKTAAELNNLLTYANTGGHFFATHFSFTWLTQPWNMPNNLPFTTTAAWAVDTNTNIPAMTGNVSFNPPPAHPGVFVNWLNYVGALSNGNPAGAPPNPANVAITVARHDVNNTLLQSVDWIDGTDPGNQSQMLLHYTFDTPVGATSGQCGHAIYSDFHVTNQNNASNFDFTQPARVMPTRPSGSDSECGTNPMTAQEKILEFMIWDLASCVPGPPTSTCTPRTCMQQNIGCGPAGDGCGNQIMCPPCPAGQTCGGGGVPYQCGAPPADAGRCVGKTCQQQNIGCGPAGDGCGNQIMCPPCPAGQTCGGGGVPSQCAPPGGTCVPLTCAQQNINCGPAGDGCGGLLQCGPPGGCPGNQTCGGGGVSGQCGSMCTPVTCMSQNISCGPAGDGCGGLLQCGPCTPPQTCGGGGMPGVCGAPPNSCPPLTCMSQNISCGPAGDGCGGQLDCGPCPAGQTCGGGGPGKCGTGVCTPQTCQQLGIQCGPAGDGCGGLVACGMCLAGQTCGGPGHPGQCVGNVQ
jgi:hypothetical protein